jgi:FAD:protein FMN transferase
MFMRRCRPLLGTFVEIECDRGDAIEPAFAAVERIHRLMSAHEPDSELSRINRVAHLGRIEISPETGAVLARALEWSRASGGVFDVVRAGGNALATGCLSLHADQPQPGPDVDWRDVVMSHSSVSLSRPACIDLGGIAKGYAVDLAVKALQRTGARSGLVNAGGDMRGFGDAAWPVTVVDPRRRDLVQIHLDNTGLATSAGLPAAAGLSFAHLTRIDPRWTSVTVRAPDACNADALTKIVWALGHGAADLLASAGADAIAIRADGTVEEIGRRALAA